MCGGISSNQQITLKMLCKLHIHYIFVNKTCMVSLQIYYCKRTFTFAGKNKKRDSACGHNTYRVVIQNRSAGTVNIP